MRPLRFLTAATTAVLLASSSVFLSTTEALATEPTPLASPLVFAKPGDTGEDVAQVQAWLTRLGLLGSHQDARYDDATTAAVKAFQKQRGLDQSGIVDNTTRDLLSARAVPAATTTTGAPPVKKVVRRIASPLPRPRPTPKPTPKPRPKPPVSDVVKYQLNSRCDDEARVICADQSRRKVWYLENGKVVKQFDARFGAPRSTPTRNGTWRITRKVKNEWSYLYHVPMPYSMYFSGGQAFHYSADFARVGWNNARGGSHGCVNIRDANGLAWVFHRVPVGTLAIVQA